MPCGATVVRGTCLVWWTFPADCLEPPFRLVVSQAARSLSLLHHAIMPAACSAPCRATGSYAVAMQAPHCAAVDPESLQSICSHVIAWCVCPTCALVTCHSCVWSWLGAQIWRCWGRCRKRRWACQTSRTLRASSAPAAGERFCYPWLRLWPPALNFISAPAAASPRACCRAAAVAESYAFSPPLGQQAVSALGSAAPGAPLVCTYVGQLGRFPWPAAACCMSRPIWAGWATLLPYQRNLLLHHADVSQWAAGGHELLRSSASTAAKAINLTGQCCGPSMFVCIGTAQQVVCGNSQLQRVIGLCSCKGWHYSHASPVCRHRTVSDMQDQGPLGWQSGKLHTRWQHGLNCPGPKAVHKMFVQLTCSWVAELWMCAGTARWATCRTGGWTNQDAHRCLCSSAAAEVWMCAGTARWATCRVRCWTDQDVQMRYTRCSCSSQKCKCVQAPHGERHAGSGAAGCPGNPRGGPAQQVPDRQPPEAGPGLQAPVPGGGQSGPRRAQPQPAPANHLPRWYGFWAEMESVPVLGRAGCSG